MTDVVGVDIFEEFYKTKIDMAMAGENVNYTEWVSSKARGMNVVSIFAYYHIVMKLEMQLKQHSMRMILSS